MTRTQTMVQLNDELVALLDAEAAAAGVDTLRRIDAEERADGLAPW